MKILRYTKYSYIPKLHEMKKYPIKYKFPAAAKQPFVDIEFLHIMSEYYSRPNNLNIEFLYYVWLLFCPFKYHPDLSYPVSNETDDDDDE